MQLNEKQEQIETLRFWIKEALLGKARLTPEDLALVEDLGTQLAETCAVSPVQQAKLLAIYEKATA